MSWHFLQEQEEASWEANCLDGAPFALSSLIPTAAGYCLPDSGMDSCRDFRSGTTSPRSTASRGAEESMWLAGDFPAPTLAVPGKRKASKAASRVFGRKWPESLAKYDPGAFLWRTRQCLLIGGLTESLAILPRWGMTRGGELWELSTPKLLIAGSEFGLWHTPRAKECAERSETFVKRNGDRGAHCFSGLTAQARASQKMLPTPTVCGNYNRRGASKTSGDGLATVVGGSLNPNWTEWHMGWPVGWTDLKPLATDKFRRWCDSHGISWEARDED